VVVRDDGGSGAQMVGYVVPAEGGPAPDPAALSALLGDSLPAYMVPGAYVMIDTLPLTANGKLDRAALPAPLAAPRRHDPPRTPQEELLAAVFAELLGVDRVGRNDSFFALGGHSLLATQLAARVRAVFACELPLRTVFDAPTPATLAERCRSRRSGCGSSISLAARARPIMCRWQRFWRGSLTWQRLAGR
jgi:acyl carrier protein